MIVYFGTTVVWPVGHQFPANATATGGHQTRMRGSLGWQTMELAFEQHRLPHEQSRTTASFTCEHLAESVLFMRAQQFDPYTAVRVDTKQLHFYEAEMPNPTRCVMPLCARGTYRYADRAALAEIAAEYCRQPSYEWEYFEYLGATMTIIQEVQPPPEMEVGVAKMSHQNDTDQSLAIWPYPKR